MACVFAVYVIGSGWTDIRSAGQTDGEYQQVDDLIVSPTDRDFSISIRIGVRLTMGYSIND